MNTQAFRPFLSAIDSTATLMQIFWLILTVECYAIISMKKSIMGPSMTFSELGINALIAIIFILVAYRLLWAITVFLRALIPLTFPSSWDIDINKNETPDRTSFTAFILWITSWTYLYLIHSYPEELDLLPVPKDSIWEQLYIATIGLPSMIAFMIVIYTTAKLDSLDSNKSD